MASAESTLITPPIALAPAWRVSVLPPRTKAREKHWQLRARCRLPGGRVLERRTSSETENRARAEELGRALEADLNRGREPGSAWTVLEAAEARAVALEAEGRERAAYRLRQAARRVGAFGATTDRELDRAGLLRARDALLADGLGAGAVRTTFKLIAAAWRWAHERGNVTTAWPAVKGLRVPPTAKRPASDAEVSAFLAWSETYQGGRWAGLFHALADTGRRVGELLRLRGRDVRHEAGVLELGRTKSGAVHRVPVPAPTMALLPDAAPDAYLWPARPRRDAPGARPTSDGAVLAIFRKGLLAIGVVDASRLDVHSLRRAFVATAERAGVPCDVGRRVTGHASRAMWDTYQAQAVGDDLRGVVEAVRARRVATPASPAPPPVDPQAALEHARKLSEAQGSRQVAGGECEFRRNTLEAPQVESGPSLFVTPAGEAKREMVPVPVRVDGRPWGGQDPAVTTLCQWADQDPLTMLRLLLDPELRHQLHRAIVDVIGPAQQASYSQVAG